MPIVGVDHVQLAMPTGREAEAREFYCRLLGVSEVRKPPALASRGGAWFANSRVKVHLGVDPEFRPARKAHPGLLVTGLEALVQRLREAGYEVMEDELLEGYHWAYANDAFGNRLELMEPRRDE